jgi:TolA-binding protein
MQYAEALFWHASLAATAAEAERDYRRLIVEFPLSPRSEEALMRLAQMENARGERALALQHIDRLLLEHPTSPQRARAGYWKGRFLLEGGDVTQACAAFAGALAGAPPSDAELRHQLEYYGRPCPSGPARPPATVSAGASAPCALGETIGLVSEPMPSISTVTTSHGCR